MQPLTTRPILEMRGIPRRFPGVLALDEVDLSVGRDEVVALIGENGAGKSALMKILGGIHLPDGVLVAKLKLQPFVVTLCGMFAGRGLARIIGQDESRGFGSGFEGLKFIVEGKILWIPVPVYILAVVAALSWLFLSRMVWGRHLLALGRNEEAARYSGISVDRLKIAACTIAGLLAAVAGILFALYSGTVQPSSAGMSQELKAIAAAVLGGVSLRGGEGSIAGVLVGAATLMMIQNSISMLQIPDYTMDFIAGAVILVAVAADEIVKRRRAASRAARRSGS